MTNALLKIAAVLLLGTALIIGIQPSSAGDNFKREPGFVSLFNGKDLTGWEYRTLEKKKVKVEELAGKTETDDQRIQVADGVLVINRKDSRGRTRITDLYTTKVFDKDFILKLEFRASPRSDSGVHIRGNQLQVRDYPTVGPYNQVKGFKNGDWNELEIIVKGNFAECKCNGEILEKAYGVPASGGIGLQAEAGKFEYRRIRIKELH